MVDEKELLLDIKKQFGWPVDTLRYNLQAQGRFWNGKAYSAALPPEIEQRVQESWKKINYVQGRIGILPLIPWVQGIFLTGSVASLNAQVADDIDLWLIVDEKRIWLTRAIDFLFYTLLGQRRLAKHGVDAHNVRNRFCFNLYTTLSGLEFTKQTPSFAMQFIDAIPLFLRTESIYKQLIEKNSWVSRFFPSWYRAQQEQVYRCATFSKIQPRGVIRGLSGAILDFLESVAGFLMYSKMHKKLPKKSSIFVSRFTTWESDRILSSYEETITKRS